MAIVHEAFLCDVAKLKQVVAMIARALTTPAGALERIGAEVLRAYDRHALVRTLADECGSWDRAGLATLIHEESTPFQWRLQVFQAHLIYSTLFESQESFGLGGDWRLLHRWLEACGWNPDDLRTLIYGEHVENFIDGLSIIPSGDVATTLQGIVPPSTASSMGFIDPAAARRLAALLDDQPATAADLSPAELARLPGIKARAAHMLTQAIDQEMPILAILSG